MLVLASVALNVTGTLMHHANPTLFTVVLRTVGEAQASGQRPTQPGTEPVVLFGVFNRKLT